MELARRPPGCYHRRMTEPTPQEIAARVRGMAQELADARAALHLKPGQSIGDRIRGLTEELDGRATSIEALRGDLDGVRAALSLAERKITERAQERSAMWDVLLAVREAAGADEGADLRAVVAGLRQEAALALPSRQSDLPQPTVTATADGRIRVEIRHTNDLALEYLYDLPEAARLVADVGTAVARLTPGGPRLGVTADPGAGASFGVCVEIAGEARHLSPPARLEGPRLRSALAAMSAGLPPAEARLLAAEVWRRADELDPIEPGRFGASASPVGDHVALGLADDQPAHVLTRGQAGRLAVKLARLAGEVDPLAPLRAAGVLGRGALTEAVPERVAALVLERVRADRREIERLRAANAEHVARLASGTSGAGKRKRIAALGAEVERLERLERELRGVELWAAGQGETIKGYQDAASAVVAAAESVGLRVAPSAGSPSPSTVKAAAQDLAAKAARVAGLEDLLAGERAKTLEARREFAELRDAARTMLPEGSTPNPATGWLADVIRGAAKRAGELLAARDLAHENANRARAAEGAAVLRALEAEAKVARLAQSPATIALPPALRQALDAVQDVVAGVEATPEGLGEAVIKLVAELRKARRGWAEESGAAARARVELRKVQDAALPQSAGHRPTRLDPAALSWGGVKVFAYPGPGSPDLASGLEQARAAVARLTAELAKRADPEAVRKISAQANTARQLAEEVQVWQAWATEQIGSYPIGSRGLRATLAERLAKALADRDASRRAAEELRKALAAVGDLTA